MVCWSPVRDDQKAKPRVLAQNDLQGRFDAAAGFRASSPQKACISGNMTGVYTWHEPGSNQAAVLLILSYGLRLS
jgi:hypothetical protein